MTSPNFPYNSYGQGSDTEYEDAPSMGKGPAQDNPYSGAPPGRTNAGASVPLGVEIDLTRLMRQAAEAVLTDVLTARQPHDRA